MSESPKFVSRFAGVDWKSMEAPRRRSVVKQVLNDRLSLGAKHDAVCAVCIRNRDGEGRFQAFFADLRQVGKSFMRLFQLRDANCKLPKDNPKERLSGSVIRAVLFVGVTGHECALPAYVHRILGASRVRGHDGSPS